VARISALILNSVFLCGAVLAQQQAPAKDKPDHKAAPKEQAPPEEDTEAVPPAPKEYSFNPIQAEKEVQIGNYYFKKGSYKAAATRFQEAVKWNPGLAEGYLRLGDSEEKLSEKDAARKAYSKFVDLAPNDKRSDAIKKKLNKKN
jgi:tetratricopeptide (TPR) repeat protein